MPGPPLTPTEFSSAVSAISAAFGDPTRRDIYLFARQRADGVTAAEIADHFALHPNVARHHLDKLTGGGYLEVAVPRDGRTGAGRPSKRYRATAPDDGLAIPVRHDDLLVMLLGRTLALLPPDAAATMAEEVGIEYGRMMAKAMGPTEDHQRSFRAALARRRRRVDRARFRRPRREAQRRVAHRLGALPLRRRGAREPGHLRRRPRPGEGHARRDLRRRRRPSSKRPRLSATMPVSRVSARARTHVRRG